MATYYVNSYRNDDGKFTLGATIEIGGPPDEDTLSQRIRAAWKVDGVDSNDEAIGTLLTYFADQWVGSDITITRLIPRERTNEEKLDEARSILRADYWDDVRSVVKDIQDEIESGNLQTRDAVTEYLDERIDSAHRVIYTYAAMETVIFSDNDGAYEEHFGSEGIVEDGQVQWSKLAFYAMQADAYELLGDVDELLVEARSECYLCDRPFTEDDETEIYEGAYGNEKQRIHVECPEDEEEEDDGDDR